MSHPGYQRRPANENTPPYMRIGIRLPGQPLGSLPATSDIRVSFLAFLNRLPIRSILAATTIVEDSATWRAQDGQGRFNFGAVLSDGSENAPVAWARLLLPQAEGSYYGQDAGRALLILHIEPRTPDGSPAPPVALPLWGKRLIHALDLPSSLDKFLARDLELSTTCSQPAQIAVSLQAPRSLSELVNTRNITALPGSPATNSFNAWATATPNGQGPAKLVQRWLTDMCDNALYLDGYEPVLDPLGAPDQQPAPDPGQQVRADRDTTIEIWNEPTRASLDVLGQDPADSLPTARSRLPTARSRNPGASPARKGTHAAGNTAVHTRAYERCTNMTLSALEAVTTPETASAFAVEIGQRIRDTAARTAEFYIGEFYNMFKDAVVTKGKAELEECQHEARDAKAQAAAISAQLEERLNAARAAGDSQAEHEVWRDREIQQAAVQARLDQATKRAGLVGLRIDACNELAAALGISFD